MISSKKTFIFVEAVLAVLLLLLFSLILRDRSGKPREKVSVILQNSEDGRWDSFKYGLRMAAEDEGLEVYVVSTGERLTAEEERQLIAQEVESGAEAILVQPANGRETTDYLETVKLPVMLVGNRPSGEALAVTEPDNGAMGENLAQEVLADFNGNLAGKTLGLVLKSDGSGAAQSRREGFTKALEDSGARIGWSVEQKTGDEPVLEQQPRVDLVIAFDDESLKEAGKCSASYNLHGALLYGIGTSAEAVYYLDIGIAECVIVPDGFLMGYESLTATAAKIRSPFGRLKDGTVRHLVMRRDMLFTKENQEILYTMSQ